MAGDASLALSMTVWGAGRMFLGFRRAFRVEFSILLCAVVACGAGACVAQDDGTELAERFRTLDRRTVWTPVSEFRMDFDAHHPQGMTMVGDRIFLSSVEVLNRAKARGIAHLFEMDAKGALLRSVELQDGAIYHPGGIDFDGESIWVSVAEYRPDSRSIVYAVDPKTLSAEKILSFDDHLGAIVHDRENRQLVAVSWGSRRIYRWPLRDVGGQWRPVDAGAPIVIPNPSHYVDYQDMQMLGGTGMALCSGLATVGGSLARGSIARRSFALGGIDLVDLGDVRPAHQLPIPLWTASGKPYTQNPFYVQSRETGLRFYFLPDDGRGTMYIVEAKARRRN